MLGTGCSPRPQLIDEGSRQVVTGQTANEHVGNPNDPLAIVGLQTEASTGEG